MAFAALVFQPRFVSTYKDQFLPKSFAHRTIYL